jgi:hypothetical protein
MDTDSKTNRRDRREHKTLPLRSLRPFAAEVVFRISDFGFVSGFGFRISDLCHDMLRLMTLRIATLGLIRVDSWLASLLFIALD